MISLKRALEEFPTLCIRLSYSQDNSKPVYWVKVPRQSVAASGTTLEKAVTAFVQEHRATEDVLAKSISTRCHCCGVRYKRIFHSQRKYVKPPDRRYKNSKPTLATHTVYVDHTGRQWNGRQCPNCKNLPTEKE